MTYPSQIDDQDVTHLLRSFVEQVESYAVILLRPDGEVLWCNAGAERLFRRPRKEFVGLPLTEIFTDRDRAAGLDRLELAIASANTVSEDDRWHVRADGSRFWTTGGLIALRDSAGTLLGFGKIVRDRTDLKTQLELLANQVKNAHTGNEDKDRAITKLSHELRNVIGGLRGAVELLDQPLDNEQRRLRFAQLMMNQLAVLDRLTQDLLDVKRSVAGKITLNREPVTVQDELRDLLAARERQMQQSRLIVQLLAPQVDIVVDGDRIRLRQVFGNLIDNAIKYTPAEGRIWIKVTAEDRYAVIHVQDTGRGLPPDMLSSIFDLFTQVDAQTSSGGLGVGLALVRELVLLHGGSVQATSPGLGQGSEFTVRLPLRDAAIESTR